jgi:hypothetical protein
MGSTVDSAVDSAMDLAPELESAQEMALEVELLVSDLEVNQAHALEPVLAMDLAARADLAAAVQTRMAD